MLKIWSDEAWEDYLYWQKQDKKTLLKINNLLKSIINNAIEILQCASHYEDK